MSIAMIPIKDLVASQEMPHEQIELVKRTVAKGATDDELALFLYQAKRAGLDPLSRQIHFIKRWDATQGREVGIVQTGIDGLRLIASRTGRYRPDEEAARFTLTEKKQLFSAKVRVYVIAGGQWFPVEAEAYYDEYLQTRKDKQTGEILATAMWRRMPRLMLAKCAEALALRKAFPAELSGIYAAEEFGDASGMAPETGAASAPGGQPVHVDQETGEIASPGTALQRLQTAMDATETTEAQALQTARKLFGSKDLKVRVLADLSDAQIDQLIGEVEVKA